MDFPIVEVEWEDAVETSEWSEVDSLRNRPMPTRSVGYLVKKSKRAITLVSLLNDHHSSLGVTIPTGMVRRIHLLTRDGDSDGR